MKKLMIAAGAVIAAGSTFAGLCSVDAVEGSCSVYNAKFTFKTLQAKKACAEGAKWLVTDAAPGAGGWTVWYKDTAADAGAQAIAAAAPHALSEADYLATPEVICGDATRPVQRASSRQVYWMDNGTRKFEGVLWQCAAACFEGAVQDCDLNNNGRLNYAIWEKKSSLSLTFPIIQIKYGEDDGAKFTGAVDHIYAADDAQRTMWIGRYGKSAQKVAAYWQPTLRHAQIINAAGFGTYDVKNLRTKSVSGNAVGMIAPLNDIVVDACGHRGNFFCAIGFMCIEWADWCCDGCYAGVELVPASGTWSVKYNASATKKANADKATLTAFVPAYAFYSHSSWEAVRALDPWLHTDNTYWYGNTTGALIYKDGGAAGAGQDEIINAIVDYNIQLVSIYEDGAYDAATKTYKYNGVDFTVGDNGAFSGDDLKPLFPEPAE